MRATRRGGAARLRREPHAQEAAQPDLTGDRLEAGHLGAERLPHQRAQRRFQHGIGTRAAGHRAQPKNT